MPHHAIHEIMATPQGAGTSEAQRIRALGLLVLCWLLAGGVFVVAKWAGPFTPPWTMVFTRMLLAALCLLPFAIPHHREMAARLRRHFVAIILIAAALAFTQGFMFTALGYTSAITASIVFSIWPITAIILAALFLGEHFTLRQAAGVILCFGGVLVIVGQGNPERIVHLDLNAGDLWMLGAVICMAVYTILLKKTRIELPPLPLLALVFVTATLISTPFFVREMFHDARIALDWHDILALGYIGTLGGGLMFLLYNTGVSILGAARASVTFYLQAFFTTILAYFFLGEKLHLYHVAGIALIASGIVIVVLIKQKLTERSTIPGHGG